MVIQEIHLEDLDLVHVFSALRFAIVTLQQHTDYLTLTENAWPVTPGPVTPGASDPRVMSVILTDS